jgi:hypothetical protein
MWSSISGDRVGEKDTDMSQSHVRNVFTKAVQPAPTFKSENTERAPTCTTVLAPISQHEAIRAQSGRLAQLSRPVTEGEFHDLSRDSYPGYDFFTPNGLEAVAREEPDARAIGGARLDLARMMGQGYRPGAEQVTLVTWLRTNGSDAVRSGRNIGLDTVVPIDELAMLLVGYTDTIIHVGGRALGRQAVAVIATIRQENGGSDDNNLTAVPVAVRDITWAYGSADCYDPFVLDNEAGFMAAALLGGFNLVNEIRHYSDPLDMCTPWAPDEGTHWAAAGPLVARYVPGPVDADGVPISYVFQPARYAGISMTSVIEGAPAAASFGHLPNGSVVRGRPRGYFNAFPWAIVPGNVKDPGPDGIRAGDVIYRVPSETGTS